MQGISLVYLGLKCISRSEFCPYFHNSFGKQNRFLIFFIKEQACKIFCPSSAPVMCSSRDILIKFEPTTEEETLKIKLIMSTRIKADRCMLPIEASQTLPFTEICSFCLDGVRKEGLAAVRSVVFEKVSEGSSGLMISQELRMKRSRPWRVKERIVLIETTDAIVSKPRMTWLNK